MVGLASMNELDSLRQEAETLKNAIRVSITTFGTVYSMFIIYLKIHIYKKLAIREVPVFNIFFLSL